MNCALIFAGGHGERMGVKYNIPKQFIKINKKPILIYTLEIFEKVYSVDYIVLVAPIDYLKYTRQILEDYNITKVKSIVPGGNSAMESIRNGLIKLKEFCPDDSIVIVHDGVRPMITPKLVEDSIENTKKKGSSVTAIPCTETILLSNDGGCTSSETFPRQKLYKGQAPQTYFLKNLWDAFQKIEDFSKYSHIVDCASLFLDLKKNIHLIQGEYGNIKITTPSDVNLFKSYLLNSYEKRDLKIKQQEKKTEKNISSFDSILWEDMENLLPEISDEWNHKTFLITGATGMIGRQIVLSLLLANQKKHFSIKILAVTRNIERAKKTFHFFPKKEDVKIITWEELPLYYSDFVIHCAAPTNSQFFVDFPVETMNSIMTSTDFILNYSREKKCSAVIFLSSMEIYGETSQFMDALKENDLGNIDLSSVRSSYPMAKRFSELLCLSYIKEYNLPVVVLRLAQTFGPWIDEQDQRLFAYLAQSVLSKKDINLCSSGRTYRNYCYTADAISAIFIVLKKNVFGETFNVANPHTNCSVSEMAEMAGRIGNVKVQYCSSVNTRYRAECRTVLNVDKILNLGWKPSYDLEEMFQRMLLSMRYFKDNIFTTNKHGV